MRLLVLFRSCSRVYSVHGVQRFIQASKNEIVRRCLRSLIVALEGAMEFPGLSIQLHVFDDHSDPECVQGMQSLLRDGHFPTQFVSLTNHGNAASLLSNYSFARDKECDLIYFVEDDYLHAPTAIKEMLAAHEQLSQALGREIVVYPCDEPRNYQELEPTQVLATNTHHWRGIRRTTGTMMLSKKTFLEHLDKFMAFSRYEPGSGITEDNTINMIYRTVPCVCPLPGLAVHINHEPPPPVVKWRDWWGRSGMPAQNLEMRPRVGL